jgi:hypothetical protein
MLCFLVVAFKFLPSVSEISTRYCFIEHMKVVVHLIPPQYLLIIQTL